MQNGWERSKKQDNKGITKATIIKHTDCKLYTYLIALDQVLKLKGQKDNHQEGCLSSTHISQETDTSLNLQNNTSLQGTHLYECLL